MTRAPTRIDFGGGWTDVPPYSDEMGGFVCNLAISRYATVTLARGEGVGGNAHGEPQMSLPDRAIVDAAARRMSMRDAAISVQSDFPIGAGLGGSSAAGVATVAALAAARGETLGETEMAELSRDIEIADVGIAGGRQDHYAAVYGGALGLRFRRGAVDVERLRLDAETRREIERRCIIVYTGQSRISGDTINAVIDSYRQRDARVLNALANMRDGAERMAGALSAGRVDELAVLVAEQWTHQRSLHSAIPTPLIDDIIARASHAGAAGAKALGASGGGCVLLIAKADRVEEVRRAIETMGTILPFTVDEDGVTRCR